MHDAGKLFLNKDVLYKPGKLTKDERIFVESHANLGYKALRDCGFNNTILSIVKSHHERLNGMGYPDAIDYTNMSVYLQIAGVADVYNALTSKRCYKKALQKSKTFEIMRKDNGLNQIMVTILEEYLR